MPYVDDSTAESPLSDDNVVGLASNFLDAPAGGLASLTGLTNLSTDFPPGAQLPVTSRMYWPSDRDDVISLMTGLRSRQNSYCSHGSRWSYSSHVEQSFGNLRSVSRLQEAQHAACGGGGGSNGTRSCRNSLLAGVPGSLNMPVGTTADVLGGPPLVPSEIYDATLYDGSLSEDVSLWPPDYVVREQSYRYLFKQISKFLEGIFYGIRS